MESAANEIVFKKETISKLLTLFFKEDKTKGAEEGATCALKRKKEATIRTKGRENTYRGRRSSVLSPWPPSLPLQRRTRQRLF
nr:centromere protein X isoform X2 [Misgurnus anguillicaudatus]